MFILHVVQACQNIMIFCSFVVFAFCTLIFIFVAFSHFWVRFMFYYFLVDLSPLIQLCKPSLNTTFCFKW